MLAVLPNSPPPAVLVEPNPPKPVEAVVVVLLPNRGLAWVLAPPNNPPLVVEELAPPNRPPVLAEVVWPKPGMQK